MLQVFHFHLLWGDLRFQKKSTSNLFLCLLCKTWRRDKYQNTLKNQLLALSEISCYLSVSSTLSLSLSRPLFHYISLPLPLHFLFYSFLPFHSATLFLRILCLSTFLCLSSRLQHSCMLTCWGRSARCVGFNLPEGWLGGCWKLVCWD